MLFSDIVKEKVRIIDIATDYGLTVKPLSRNEYTLVEHDSVRINSEKNMFFRHSQNIGGSVIDFVIMLENCNFETALSILRRYCSTQQVSTYSYARQTNFFENRQEDISQHKKEKFTLPPKATTMKRLYAYLVETRAINKEIVDFMVERKYLYESSEKNPKHDKNIHNGVFLGYNKNAEIKYAFKRSICSSSGWRGDVKGSENIGIYIDNNSDSLFVTEAIIDSMSIMSILLLNNTEHTNYDYLSLSGVSTKPLKYHLEGRNIKRLFLCLDNDTAGNKRREVIKQELNGKFNGAIFDKIPKSKDFNDDLKMIKRSFSNEKNN